MSVFQKIPLTKHFGITWKRPEVLGQTTKNNKDWFDENNQEIQELLAKRSAHWAHLAQPYCPEKKAAFHRVYLQCKLREIQVNWWNNLETKTRLCADTSDYGFFCESPQDYIPVPVSFVQCRWPGAFHRQGIHPEPVFWALSGPLQCQPYSQKPVRVELLEPPSMKEVIKAKKQLNGGRSVGFDGIPSENSMSIGGSRSHYHKTPTMQS